MGQEATVREVWTISIRSDFDVVRLDPEYADIDHPNGEVVGEVFYLIATDERGNRRAFGSFSSEEQAEAAIPDAPSIEEWVDTYPEYGSQAFIEYGEEDLIYSEREHNDAILAGLDTRFMRF